MVQRFIDSVSDIGRKSCSLFLVVKQQQQKIQASGFGKLAFEFYFDPSFTWGKEFEKNGGISIKSDYLNMLT